MEDNEQIIIDGVNVSQCEFYIYYSSDRYPHRCGIHRDMFGMPACCDIADCCKSCYFKQLQRSVVRIKDLEERIINHSNTVEEYCSRLAKKRKRMRGTEKKS